ncbi:MAG TPA: two-component regulator propeller domain-containing protein [Bacteroidales bacterium]|nr:two-component regulator propeller domain-containing protein [Bacteroidales bacterium]
MRNFTCSILVLTLLEISTCWTFGQGIPVGSWRHHLPNNQIIALAETPDKVIGATPFGLIIFNRDDNSLERKDKVTGLTDIGIRTISYAAGRNLLLIGYSNGNIDVVKGEEVFNVPDIRQSRIMGSKRINNILVVENRAFLSCDFGIVELDLTNFLIRNTYFIGPLGSQVRVFEIAHTGSHLFAATSAGLLRAPATGVNLADFQNWHRINLSGQSTEVVDMVVHFRGMVLANLNLPSNDALYVFDGVSWQLFRPGGQQYLGQRRRIRATNDRLLISNDLHVDVFDQNLVLTERIDFYSNVIVRAHDVLLDRDQLLWFGDDFYGLVRRDSPGNFSLFAPQGPSTSNVFDLDVAGGALWVAPGAITPAGGNIWNADGVFRFANENWHWFNRFDHPVMAPATDIIRIKSDPGNPGTAYAATWTNGLLEFKDGVPSVMWNETNSTLQRRAEAGDFVRIGGIAIDRRGYVWVTNSNSTRPIAVKRSNNQWFSFSSRGFISPTQMITCLVIDHTDQKWAILPNGGGIFVFRENSFANENDTEVRRLSTIEGSGNLPSNNVHSLAIDHDGFVWVGTDNGVSVIYSPQRVLRGEPVNAQQIVVRQDGFAGILFENETVNSITVDGSNKKWFGTSRSGAFLLSADGRQTLLHFTAENSPLPSNNILDIAINGQNGEVFFATDRGIASFRGFATEAPITHTNVRAFPNPVRPGYDGYISVTGLVRNARVKITDINGNLVYETIAEGGQAVWNGRDVFGNRPASGVYLVFSTNQDGSETMVTKILFIN